MACTNEEHSCDCNCDRDGKIVPIQVIDGNITGYNGLIGSIPEDEQLLARFNGLIEQYGNLDAVCEAFPYVNMNLNRYGIFVPEDGNYFSKFSNLYHIMRAQRKFESSNYNKMPSQQTQANQQVFNPIDQRPIANYRTRNQNTFNHNGYVPACVEDEEDENQVYGFNSQSMDDSTSQNFMVNTGFVPSSVDYTPVSREDEQFEIAVSQAFVSRPNDAPKIDPTIGFESLKMVENEKNDGYSFHHDKINTVEPEGGIVNFNPDWHPNDPKNYIDPVKPLQAYPFMPLVPQMGVHTQGMINENKPGKESFLSLGKFVEERMAQKAQERGEIQIPPSNQVPWRPNHLVIKTNEFPDGVDEANPEFERVRRQVSFNCFPESSIADASIPRVDPTNSNIIDTGDPYTFNNVFANDNVENTLLEEQFGDRARASYNDNNSGIDRYMAANQLPPTMPLPVGNPYFANNPWLQSHQAQMNNINPGVGGYYGFTPGMMPFTGVMDSFQSDNEWMLSTQEEIKLGRSPDVTVITGDQIFKDDKVDFEPRVSDLDKIKVALVRPHKDENGVDYDEYLCGDKEAVKAKPSANSLGYKEATTVAKRKELEDDTYNLVKELVRYNTDLADNLLWCQQNIGTEEFMSIKRDAQKQLLKYRGDDKLSIIKSGVFIAGDKTCIMPGKPTTMKELEQIVDDELSKHKTQGDKEAEVVDKYRNITSALNMQRRIIFNGNSVGEIVTKLQALTDMHINCGDEEIKIFDKMNTYVKEHLPPIKITERDNYLIWKKLTKGARTYRGDDMGNFDREFDEWWMQPRNKTPEQKRREYEQWQNKMTGLNIQHLNNIATNSISPEERGKRYEQAILKSWRDYDQGVITPDMNLYDFLDNANFLLTRNQELKYQKYSNEARRLYDPVAYLAEVRKHSALRNFKDGKGFTPTMDLVDPNLYQKKRQAFIDQIFKKANRGTIT